MAQPNVNDYGISNEPVADFMQRNNYPANKTYPQNLTSGLEIHKSDKLAFLPIEDWKDTADWDQMLFEAERLERHYVPHRRHESHQGWSSLCIHGLSSVHTESTHTYGMTDDDAPWRWTDVADWCPTITDFFKSQFDYTKYYRLRIMKLEPGGWIMPHRDSTELSENHVGPTNVAINNPDGCNFAMDGVGNLPWEPGVAIKLNLYNVHSVYNNSKKNRYHMIVHGHLGKSWPNRMLTNYNKWKNIYV